MMSNIGVMRLSSLGDTILVSPVLKALKLKFPEANLSLMIKNDGEIDAYNLHWKINITTRGIGGPKFFALGAQRHFSGNIPLLNAANETNISLYSEQLYGLGIIELTILINTDNAEKISQSEKGILLINQWYFPPFLS